MPHPSAFHMLVRSVTFLFLTCLHLGQLAELYITKHSIITAGLQPSFAEIHTGTKELLIVLDFDTAQKYGVFSGEFEVQREMRFIRKVVEECVAEKGRVVGVRCVRVNEGL